MSTTAPDTVARRTGGPTRRRVLASELLKLRGLRSTIVLLLVAVASIVLLGPINAVGQVVEDEPVHGVGDALSLVLMGASNAAILLGVLGVLSATSEYAYDSVHVTFTAVPRRADVVLGKALALTSALVPVVMVSVAIAWEAGRRILHHGGADLGWTDPDVVRVWRPTTWYVAGWALLGQSLGWLLRSAVGAASALLGVMFVLPVLTLLIPGRGRRRRRTTDGLRSRRRDAPYGPAGSWPRPARRRPHLDPLPRLAIGTAVLATKPPRRLTTRAQQLSTNPTEPGAMTTMTTTPIRGLDTRALVPFVAVALPVGWVLLSIPLVADLPVEPFVLATLLLGLVAPALLLTRRDPETTIRALLRDCWRVPRPLVLLPALLLIPVTTWAVAGPTAPTSTAV